MVKKRVEEFVEVRIKCCTNALPATASVTETFTIHSDALLCLAMHVGLYVCMAWSGIAQSCGVHGKGLACKTKYSVTKASAVYALCMHCFVSGLYWEPHPLNSALEL